MSVADILLTPLTPSRLAVHRVATRYASTDRTLVMLSNSGFGYHATSPAQCNDCT